IYIALAYGIFDFVNSDAAAGKRIWVELDVNGISLSAINENLGHAVDHRDSLGQQRFSIIVNGGKRQSVRCQSHEEDWLIGWIDLVVNGRGRHAGRQLASGFSNRGLHVLAGGIDVT